MTIREYFESQRWTFAKNYVAFAPHEYIVKSKVADKELFDKAVDYIMENGIRMFYYKHERKYLFTGGWFYWVMRDSVDDPTAIINRCRPEDYDIVFMKRGTQARGMAAKNSKLESIKEPPAYEQVEMDFG